MQAAVAETLKRITKEMGPNMIVAMDAKQQADDMCGSPPTGPQPVPDCQISRHQKRLLPAVSEFQRDA